MTKWTAGLLFGAGLRKNISKREKGWDICPSLFFFMKNTRWIRSY